MGNFPYHILQWPDVNLPTCDGYTLQDKCLFSKQLSFFWNEVYHVMTLAYILV